jgi:hypothetical protein
MPGRAPVQQADPVRVINVVVISVAIAIGAIAAGIGMHARGAWATDPESRL